MARRDLQAARVLITGASSGIGWALARQLAGYRTQLLLTARRGDRLDQLSKEVRSAGSEAVSQPGDVTAAPIRQALVHQVRQHWGALDVLINNAGTGAIGPFAEASEARLRQILEVNFFAAVELIRDTLPLLRAGRQPIIVNVGSVLGHRAVPLKSEYCASKFALHGFSDALRAELHGDGISVLHACPSTTQSEFFESLLEDGGQLTRRKGMSPDQVARTILRAVERDKHEVLLSAGGRLLVWLDRLCPALADTLVRRYAQ